jgi:hypothetical protein
MSYKIDEATGIWLPDRELCAIGDEIREKNEWMRQKTGLYGARPSQIGIENYRWGSGLHKKFFEGRTPPQVALDSAENIEWYEEHLKRCIYGYEYGNQRITGDHYWLLNFTPFMVAIKDSNGKVTNDFDTRFPYYSLMHDYIFKLIEEANYENKHFLWMSGRASGKTYSILSIAAKIYHLKPESHSVISASNSGHANEAFTKFLNMVNDVSKFHPTLALNRITDTQSALLSGQEVIRDGVKYQEGPRSRVNKVIYGDNPGVTRGSRPDYQLFEEIGDWAGGKGNLKACIGATLGSWRVGKLAKVRAFFIGTGGSVTSDQAKDIFYEPDAFDIISVNDFKKKTCFFLPADYLYGGCGWEETGVNNNEEAREILEDERSRKKSDMEIYSKVVQEFPFTIDEVFSRLGSNIFNQKKIAMQTTALDYEKKHMLPKAGFLEWVKSNNGAIIGVKWSENPEGDILIVEHPYKGDDGKSTYKDLYIAGVDSIDQGQLDSTSIKDRSSLGVLVKKRIVDGKYMSQSSNLYVAMYVGRSLDVRWDYENVLKLVMYYNAKVNLEYTKIGIVAYFKEMKQYDRFIKRPVIALPSGGDGNDRLLGIDNSRLIGTTSATNVIDHQDGKIKEYVDDYYDQIFFKELLEQLRDYRRTDRRKFDLVIAMGLCEIADEDLIGIMSTKEENVIIGFKAFGYYIDPRTGKKKRGVIPNKNAENEAIPREIRSNADWIDMSGRLRFDKNFESEVPI